MAKLIAYPVIGSAIGYATANENKTQEGARYGAILGLTTGAGSVLGQLPGSYVGHRLNPEYGNELRSIGGGILGSFAGHHIGQYLLGDKILREIYG